MTSFYEIGGFILSGAEAENEYAFGTGRRSAIEHKRRSDEIKSMKSVKSMLSKEEIGNTTSSDEKDSLLEHWAKMVTLPARRFAAEPKAWALPFKNPLGFGIWGVTVLIDPIVANYHYFVEGESIEEW